MKRRVNIAAGLVHQPRLLFLDEPTVGVDPQSRNQIFESVLKLNRERGMSIIYTSHYMEEVELLCNRVAIVDQGKIIALDTIKNLIALLGGGVIQIGVKQADDALVTTIAELPAVKNAMLMPVPTDGSEAAAEGAPAAAAAPEEKPQARLLKVEAENSRVAIVNVLGELNNQRISPSPRWISWNQTWRASSCT